MKITDTKIIKHNWNDSDVEKHWDKVSGIYIEENDKVKDSHNQRFGFINDIPIKPNDRVLNISSRDGEAAKFILTKEKTAKVINAEISQKLIDISRRQFEDVEHIKISTYSKLDFENEYFDNIITLETLEHVSEPVKFLKELNRVSKKGAYMLLTCPSYYNEIPYRIFTFLFGGHGEGPHRFPRVQEVMQLLSNTEWQLLKYQGTLLIPVGPRFLKELGERLILKFNNSIIPQLGIRQVFICRKV